MVLLLSACQVMQRVVHKTQVTMVEMVYQIQSAGLKA